MGVMLQEEARKRGVKKFLSIGTVCSYPKGHACTVLRRQPVGWLSGRNKRSLRAGKKNVARASASLQAAI